MLKHFDFVMAPRRDSDIPLSMMCPWGKSASAYLDTPAVKDPQKYVAYFSGGGIGETFYLQLSCPLRIVLSARSSRLMSLISCLYFFNQHRQLLLELDPGIDWRTWVVHARV